MAIDRERSIEAIRRLAGDRMTWETLAAGILEVVRSNMARALRSVSVGRGKDPMRFTLVSFGGSGGLHVFPLARALGMHEVLVPRAPGVLSALGMLGAAETVETEVTLARKGREVDARIAGRAAREACARNEERLESKRKVQHRVEICLRYTGRNEELAVPFDGRNLAASRARFHTMHEQLFGYSQPEEPIEIVSLRVVTRTPARRLPAPVLEPGGASPESARVGPGRVSEGGGGRETPLYERGLLRAGNVIRGPALVIEDTGTTLVPEYGRLEVSGDGALIGEVR
jgi:N-methylhydantoinase A